MLSKLLGYIRSHEIPAEPKKWEGSNAIKSHFEDVSLPPIREIPGMISGAEARYLYRLASTLFQDQGAFIEIGTWLGRSTIHIAHGLRTRHAKHKLISIDHFEWAGGANWTQKAQSVRKKGDDFLPDFISNLDGYLDRLDIRREKIQALRIKECPVEVVVLDAPKRLADISTVMTQLAGRLLPGTSILCWQDFMHPASFEIPACLSRFHDYLEPLHVVEDGSLVAFRVKENWTRRASGERLLSFSGWSIDYAEKIWDSWEGILPEQRKPSFRAGLSMLLHDLGHVSEAKAMLAAVSDDPIIIAQWDRWSRTSLATRYSALFAEGIVSTNTLST